jgi:tellurite resistance protein
MSIMPAAVDRRRLPNLPIAFFAMVMGLSGLTIAWEKAQHVFGIDLRINSWLVGASAAVFVLLAVLYAAKALLYREAVVRELKHPVKLNFFPAISISLLLLAVAFLPVEARASEPLWLAGTLLHLLFTLYVVNVWIHHEGLDIQHMNPAWFIPAVGNVLVPVAGVELGHVEISWFFFSAGMLFWAILLAVVFYRVLFHHPIDERLMPTLFILIAPPAVGFIAYARLGGELDTLGRVLYGSGLFLTLLLLTQVRRFARLKFFLSWWAYSFPLAAISIASMRMYELSGVEGYLWIGVALLVLLTVVVAMLLARTISAVLQHRICVPGN